VLAVLMLCPLVSAQVIQVVEISSSPNPVGSGARAIGMGGAFIGVADDATAASWNPGGLIQLETPEVSIVGAFNYRDEDTTYQAFPEASGSNTVSTTDLNYLSAAYPFQALGRNMIVSLNYQHLYDFNKKATYQYTTVEAAPSLTLTNDVDYEREGAFKTISPAYAIQISPRFSLGLTLNFYAHNLYDNKWSSQYRSNGSGVISGADFTASVNVDETYALGGMHIDFLNPSGWENINANIGVMWTIDSLFTLGAVLKTPFTARMERNFLFDAKVYYPATDTTQKYSIPESGINYLHMPMSFGTGLAYRASDALTLDVDVYWTQWSAYLLEDNTGRKSSPITGKPEDETSTEDTVQLRLGGEYLFIGTKYVVPLRAGVFYDPEPSEGSPDSFYGVSLGSGISAGPWVFDAAYQYRFGRDVRTITVGGDDATQDVDQHSVYMSLIYHF
jgi:long-subunit fatty acid transport protein